MSVLSYLQNLRYTSQNLIKSKFNKQSPVLRGDFRSVQNSRELYIIRLFKNRESRRYIALALVIVYSLSILLFPFKGAKAVSYSWTNNSDFSYNQAGKCGATTNSNLAISGTAYADGTCAALGSDSSISLAQDTSTNGVFKGDFTQISIGTEQTLALRADGTVWSWGGTSNTVGQVANLSVGSKTPLQVHDSTVTGYFTNVKEVAAGSSFSVALKNDGTVWTWGDNTFGQLGNNTTNPEALPIQVQNADGSGFLTGITHIATGSNHTVAVKSDGTAWTWGNNSNGQLGDNTTTQRNRPVQVKGVGGTGLLQDAKEVGAGGNLGLALKTDGTLVAWGQNTNGQLGDNTTTQRNTPIQVKDAAGTGVLANISAIDTGDQFTVALRGDGTVWTWGANNRAQLGDNTTTNRSLPVQVKDAVGTGFLSGVSSIAVGQEHVVALKSDGTPWAWGSNYMAAIGDGTGGNNSGIVRGLPVQVKDATGAGTLTGIRAVGANKGTSPGTSAALANDGSIWMWGQGNSGQIGDGNIYPNGTSLPRAVRQTITNDLANLSGTSSIATGDTHSAVVKSDGTVWAWGDNSSGQLGVNSTIAQPLPVQVKDAAGTGFFSGASVVSCGTYYCVVLKSDGTVWAWGNNSNGQIGDNTTTQRNIPVQVKDAAGTGTLTGITKISAGGGHVLALKNDGTVWAWGANNLGQLGDNTTTSRFLPTQVKGVGGTGNLTGVSDIAASTGLYSLALKSDGTVWAWGVNLNSRLGDGTNTQRNTPVQVKDTPGTGFLTGVSKIAAGSNHGVALKSDGTVWSWGLNTSGQLGDNTLTLRSTPVQVKDTLGTGTLTGIANIAAGSASTTALTSSGTLWSWGAGQSLGVPTVVRALTPMVVPNSDGTGTFSSVSTVAMYSNHVLALKTNGDVYSWGGNSYFQLGNNLTTYNAAPGQVKVAAVLKNITKIASSANQHSLAVHSDGTVWAWGLNNYGQLGTNSTAGAASPVQVKDASGLGYLTNVRDVAAGNLFSIALKNDGTVWAWGNNSNGRLGDGTGTQRLLPVQVKDTAGTGFLTGITKIASNADGSNSLAIDQNGKVWAWGLNNLGQLGDGSTIDRLTPVQVSDTSGSSYLGDIMEVAVGGAHGLALRIDGTVWAWGGGGNGRLGDNTTTQRNRPVQVKDTAGTGNLTSISRISAGGSHSLAVRSDGTAWAWGNNSNGQLGDNSTTQRLTPVQVKDTAGTGTLTGVASAVTGGSTTSIFLKANGEAWGAGANISNALAQGNGGPFLTPIPIRFLSNYYTASYYSSGSLSGFVYDAGAGHKNKWEAINWNTDALPAGTTVKFSARTSNNGTSWSSWSQNYSQATAGSTTGQADITSLPTTRFVELRVSMSSTDYNATPKLNDFSLSLLNDNIAPVTNASDVAMYTESGGTEIASGAWNKKATPYFSWDAGADDAGGAGLAGYCLYLGQDNSANVAQTKGALGASPVDTDGACPYVVEGTSLDTSVEGVLSSALPSSNSNYYLLVKAIDKAGNIYSGSAASFTFKHDVTPPANIAYVSLPSQFIPTKDVTITWPTSGGQTASDSNSGLAGLQYRIGNSGTWYGVNHNGNQNTTDVLANDGSYTTVPNIDYALLNEGNNLIYFRALDNAGNASTSLVSAVIKINTSAPSHPENLTATPATNTANSFGFSWSAPQTHVGDASTLTYCYTINTLPTESTCTFTSAGQTSLAAGAYATQPGENTFYVVAKDEAGNINYATTADATFVANTSAPGMPLNVEIADISVKATQNWKLALSWEPPEDLGAGISTYRIFRSLSSSSGYTQIATTSGTSYVDSSLNASHYYYKMKACDSANNCGADSGIVNQLPTGRFTSAAGLIGSPSVAASTRKAAVKWATDRESDSRIQYGTKSGEYFASEVAVSNQTKTHAVDLAGLEAGTTYYYRSRWTDEDGNTGTSSELSFTTLPAPKIKDVKVIKVSTSGATLQFTSVDSTKVNLVYGKTDNFGGSKTVNTSVAESTYNLELEGLDDGSTYSYKFVTEDPDGNSYDTLRTDLFRTPPRPRVTNLRFQPVEGEPTSTQKVTWNTNVPSGSIVTYGLVGRGGRDISESELRTDHSIIIRELLDDSNYFLLAQSRDELGNLAVSDTQIFRTSLDTRSPSISDINVESAIRGSGAEARGQIIVSWKTDEPSSSQVAYGEGSDAKVLNNRTIEDGSLKTEHIVIVSDLPTSRVFSVQPVSSDKAGNHTSGTTETTIVSKASDDIITVVLNTFKKLFGF